MTIEDGEIEDGEVRVSQDRPFRVFSSRTDKVSSYFQSFYSF